VLLTTRKRPQDVEEYIQAYPRNVQVLLQKMRKAIRKAAPDAEEIISYSMPAYRQNGILVWFAAFKNHIGFYPGVSGIERFKTELSRFKSSKGSVQFPIDKPLPLGLVGRIVKYRVSAQTMEKRKA